MSEAAAIEAKKSSSHGAFASAQSRTMLAALLLAATTLLLYSPVSRFEFINYDDDLYVTSNFQVRNGLTLRNVQWAFTTLDASNWHPLTWLSHMLDCTLFGLNPSGPHYVNLLLHVAIAVLLFLWLNRASGWLWRSAFVAALFAIHPLNVGSVAWIAERKNMLSTLFWALALIAYSWYGSRPNWRRYLAIVGMFALGLMAKPMVVTLPCVLLLLDYWPLRRIFPEGYESECGSAHPLPWRRGLELVAEKIPLFLLSAASSYITVLAQHAGGSLRTSVEFPLAVRLENAANSYLGYLGKTFWPVRLTIFYPHPGATLAPWKGAVAAVLLAVVTAAAFKLRRKCPYVIVGWMWYLVTLLPVIGVIQVGEQAMADRYAYIPLIGLFIAVVGGVAEFAGAIRVPAYVSAALGCAILVALATDTRHQLGYWHDSVSLFSHAVQISPGNYVGEENLGQALIVRGRADEAGPHFYALLKLKSDDPMAHYGLGTYFQAKNDLAHAAQEYETVLKLATGAQPGSGYRLLAQILNNLAVCHESLGRVKEAEQAFLASLKLDPDEFRVHMNLGNLFFRQERWDEAVKEYANSLKIVHSDGAYYYMAIALEKQNKLQEAAEADRQALVISPNNAMIKTHLSGIEQRLGTQPKMESRSQKQ